MKVGMWVLTLCESMQTYCFSDRSKAIAYLLFIMSLNCCKDHYTYAAESLYNSTLKGETNYIGVEVHPEVLYAEIKFVPLNPTKFMTETEFQKMLFN